MPSRRRPVPVIPIAAIAFAAAVLGSMVWYIGMSLTKTSTHQTACPEDAKICPDGSAVGRTGPKCAFATCPTLMDGTCRRTGCSGQVCSDQEVVSTCEYQTAYACYTSATCERQASGECGWTMTAELQTCLEGNYKSTNEDKTTNPEPVY